MTNKEKSVQSPLLYITQPRDVHVQASMQKYSVYKKKKEQNASVQQTEGKQDGEEFFSDQDDKKGFREMTIEEKINYLTELPSQMPKMKCEVITPDKRYRGLILDFADEVVKMRTIQKPYRVELSLSEIEDVRLMGF
ncbi:Spore coat protein CotO [Salinibacillus kushneri]|uniref:Spore coat protein CotO n=1 Tax=Salinibacillus kushneri TaxID=237682 RepID=A0A1I0J156_9BACI|nr:CotO family spore coat protein [Salinibacillus kushneri]SEU02694.1 Spore coat protein CotO [Salinibacillus kushneri]